MKSEKAITPMRCVNANPGKYVSIITNFGCHYTCPECIVRNNGLKMSETDNFSTQEPLNKVLCKERPEWVSVSGGGDPLFHWKEHWSFYEGLFHTAERRNVKLEMVYCGEENTDGIVWKRYSCKDCYNQFCARRMLAGEETWPK